MSERDEEAKPLDRAREAVTGAVERGREAARDHLSDARERFQEAAEKAREQATEAGEGARERYDETVVQLRDGYSQARDSFEGWSDDLQDYVRENPGRSILIATALGFLVGLLFRRRRDDD